MSQVTVDIQRAADALHAELGAAPATAVVLGSGLSHLAEEVEGARQLPFQRVPGLVAPGVAGHAGRFVAGTLAGAPVVLQAGRYHCYEGHPMALVAAPVRILARWGVQTFIFTNAAGGIDERLHPGDVALIEDHINLMFRSPLVGPVQPGEERFPDMSAPYDPELCARAEAVAAELGIPLLRTVYAAVLGPSYETAAEVRMLQRVGAGVVGMSTVPEVLVARALGRRCAGFSMVTNRATGLSDEPIGHDDVIRVGREAGARLARILTGLLAGISGGGGTPGTADQSTGAK